MNIKGKVVTLRAIEKGDLELMRSMLNDPEIEKMVTGWAFPLSSYEQNEWYEKNINNNNSLRFIIEIENLGSVGLVTLTDIDWKNRKAFHGLKLANNMNRKKGIGTDSVMAIMRYAFDELQLNRLDGSWLEYNIVSQKLYEKCGWKIEGRYRKYIYKNGKYNDLLIGGILQEDYKKLIMNNHYWE
ncbi:GNAT family N-acetyltransferase [Clostridium neonatale]|uniref:GNAT family N-acetyltransferase n=1 Tax=Clostridium neonatale TaxID=137838 RepID=UPI003D33B549